MTSGRYCRGILLQLFEKHAVPRDLRKCLTIRGTRNTETDRTRCAMPREPDHTRVVRKILTAKLRADADAVLRSSAPDVPCRGHETRGRVRCRLSAGGPGILCSPVSLS